MDAAANGRTLRAGHLEIRPADRAALVDGRPLTLTVRELELLTALAERAERIVGREELHAAVWAGRFRSCDRSVDVYISKLRAKLEQALPGWRYIHTHFGFGYRFSPEPIASPDPIVSPRVTVDGSNGRRAGRGP